MRSTENWLFEFRLKLYDAIQDMKESEVKKAKYTYKKKLDFKWICVETKEVFNSIKELVERYGAGIERHLFGHSENYKKMHFVKLKNTDTN